MEFDDVFTAEPPAMFTVDVEEWFHILDSPAAPPIERWDTLESRLDVGLDSLLTMLETMNVRATFFWLGWMAERHPEAVRRCHEAGHEIASHGYAHVLAYEVGREPFFQDIDRAKKTLEDLTGRPIAGFRAPGFGITEEADWAFEIIKRAGYQYDSSVFPSARGHGGRPGATLGAHMIETPAGPLPEIPMSMIEVAGRRLSLFGGGYLRISPRWLIRWGLKRLSASGQPLVVYVHPREVDPQHPRLPLGPVRRFKSYVNLQSTTSKLEWLASSRAPFCLMHDYVRERFPKAA
ncbi:MAG TPA: polysaccharide deacetylase family protein [Thermoguttaceae bacterium]|nr:polysaccharide deacetylase family protein [Thermoguttaceae bacterium]